MIVMLCTRSRGGMLSVVEAYRRAGLFDRHQINLLFTHDEGGLAYRLVLAFGALVRFTYMLVRGRVDLLHVHISMRGSFWRKALFASLARRFGVPVIGHLHGSDFDHFVTGQPKLLRCIIAGQLRRLDVVLVLGERWRDFVLSIAPTARVVVLPNSVRMPTGQAAHAVGGAVELLFLGIVGQRKGVFDLLEAFAAARAECPSLRLTVAGNGEIERAQKTATQLGLGESVVFAGWIDGAAKLKLLMRSHIYILPSHSEGLPISILEAMSWGLPIISTNVGAIAELVRHDIDGLIVPAGAPAQLTAAIVQLAKANELRLRMGRSGRERVAAEFGEDVLLPRLEKLYDEVLHSGATTGQGGFRR